MRDNGDDAFGDPLSRSDRPVHVTPLAFTSLVPISTTISSSPIISSSPPTSSSMTTTPLDLFLQSVQQALDSIRTSSQKLNVSMVKR